MLEDNFREAEQQERWGDEAAAKGDPAAGHYREAQRLLLPAGVIWTDREAYDRRMEAFERIQQKLYAGDERGGSRDESAAAFTPGPAAPVVWMETLPVWKFAAGLAVRIAQTFRDYDGQEVHAGEVLHCVESSYFFYDGGHTLRFAEKTIRLSGNVAEHEPVIANAGNAWFEPLT